MNCRIREDLSYCVVNGHAIFLDIAADQYFQLPDHVERAFLRYASASDRSPANRAMLLDQKILVPAKPGCRDDLAPRIAPPLRSVHEMPACESGSALLAVPEVMATTWRCRRHIRRGPLKGVIRETVTYRSRLCRTATAAGGLHERRIVQAATLFHRARLYAPIGTRCLMDSIALCRFLARRHLHAEIILGVTNDPFAAHCWVQAGDMVLNDTVGNAMAHTVIRVI